MVLDKKSIAEELKYLYYTWLNTQTEDTYERELNEGRYQGAILMAEWTGTFTAEEIKMLEKSVIDQLEKTRNQESRRTPL